jgi:hypothetical protein
LQHKLNRRLGYRCWVHSKEPIPITYERVKK